jgi:hypothetical protein
MVRKGSPVRVRQRALRRMPCYGAGSAAGGGPANTACGGLRTAVWKRSGNTVALRGAPAVVVDPRSAGFGNRTYPADQRSRHSGSRAARRAERSEPRRGVLDAGCPAKLAVARSGSSRARGAGRTWTSDSILTMAPEARRSGPLRALSDLETAWRHQIVLALTGGERRWLLSDVPFSYPRRRSGARVSRAVPPPAPGSPGLAADPPCR